VGFVSCPGGKKIKYRDSDRFQKATTANLMFDKESPIHVYDEGEDPENPFEWGVDIPAENPEYATPQFLRALNPRFPSQGKAKDPPPFTGVRKPVPKAENKPTATSRPMPSALPKPKPKSPAKQASRSSETAPASPKASGTPAKRSGDPPIITLDDSPTGQTPTSEKVVEGTMAW
jgi:hypothetical protein